MPASDPNYLITGAIGGVVGILGTVVAHRLIINRDARARKVDFRGFLGGWLSDIERVRGRDEAATYYAYSTKIHHFRGYAAKLNRDFPFRKKRFKALCDDLATLEPEHINNNAGDCREIVANKIKTLIEFV